MRRLVLFLSFWLLLTVAGCRSAAEGPADELLAEGRRLYAQKDYKAAWRHFKGVREYHADAPEAEEALLRLAQCDHKLDDGDDAFVRYRDLVDDYPNTRFAPEIAAGEFALGGDFLDGRMGGFLFFGPAREKGIEILEHMQVHFRHHPLADDALMRVALYAIADTEFAEAVEVLRRLLSDYPRSNYILRARFELGNALLHQSRGAVYDPRLLYDAHGAFNDFVVTTREAGQAKRYAKQIESARKSMAFVTTRLAERQYEIGQFFERFGEPSSAVHHYELCIRNYEESESAKRSRARIAALRLEKATSTTEEKTTKEKTEEAGS